jgi:hypothetical protein
MMTFTVPVLQNEHPSYLTDALPFNEVGPTDSLV